MDTIALVAADIAFERKIEVLWAMKGSRQAKREDHLPCAHEPKIARQMCRACYSRWYVRQHTPRGELSPGT